MGKQSITSSPQTLQQVSAFSNTLEEFGLNLREWIHHLQRDDISNRPAISKSLKERPILLKNKFKDGEIADAYLGAYAEWVADRAHIPRPKWVKEKERILETPWFSENTHASLLILSPASFRQRNLFTIPENPIRLRRGRPSKSEKELKAKAALRNKRYRERIRKLVALGRQTMRNPDGTKSQKDVPYN